jgi:hypothetical protein
MVAIREDSLDAMYRVGIGAIAGAALFAKAAAAQTERGGFIARLGADTVHIERFERTGNSISGTILQRTPTFRTITWRMTLDASGSPSGYEASATDASGAPILNGVSGALEFRRDTIIRTAYRNGQIETQRIAAPNGAVPSPGLPYVGVTYLSYEWAFAALRRRIATGGDSAFYQLSMNAAQPAPSKARAWVVGADSAELSYFGVAKSGYKFDQRGRLMSADWTGTTYRYRVERLSDVNVEPFARAWSDAERAKRGFGALSPRDSMTATLGAARLTIDYSRPAVRGRRIWGGIVPWDAVWRLGADVATHFTTDADLAIGDTTVPAGRYTLWMLPSETAPRLIVSRAVNVFGTNYDPSKDLARIPLTRSPATEVAERLTLSVVDGALTIRWADAVWSVPVSVKRD